MTAHRIKIGTRGSRLALIQADMVRRALAAQWPKLVESIEIVTLATAGDLDRSRPIESIGGRGVFTDDVDQALHDGLIDIAVHSVKDLPVPLDRRLVLAAMLRREDPREAFVSTRHASLADLPPRAVLGSASIRREALVRRLRPDATFALLRGNVEERLAALDRRGLDGTILAVAGLKRLGLERHITQVLEPDVLMPDPGQGAIGLVCRADDSAARFLAASVNHPATQCEVVAERAFLAAVGGCAVAGALARTSGGDVSMSATLSLAGSGRWVTGQVAGAGAAAAALGHALAQQLLDTAATTVAARLR